MFKQGPFFKYYTSELLFTCCLSIHLDLLNFKLENLKQKISPVANLLILNSRTNPILGVFTLSLIFHH